MFGKLLTLIGVIMIGIGAFGIYRANQSFSNLGLGNAMQLATDAKAREAQLCKEGETLEETQGASVYTPGSGYARSTQSFCVDAEGNRRDVTGDLVEGMIGGLDGIFSGLMGGLMGSIIYFGLLGFGIVLAIIGLIFSRRRSTVIPVTLGSSGSVYSTTLSSQGSNASVDLNQLIQQARQMKANVSSTDLMTRLKQLDDARNAGLISQTEYDRARQQLLDTFK